VSRGRLVVAAVAAVLSLATLGVFLAVAGDADRGPRVYELQPGERRYFPPGATHHGDRFTCRGQIYPLWPETPGDVGAPGVTAGHSSDGGVIATCSKQPEG
jgi:hypothetical protein